MPTQPRQSPRPYLPAAQRRGHLLDAAGRLVRRGGWAALSMQGLAAAAGVSRQLVYEHFASADELYLATLTHLFERTWASQAAVVTTGTSIDQTIRTSFALFLDLPAEERRALRTLATEADPGRRAMARARTRLRNRIASIWVPYVRLQTGASDAEASALAWMLTTAAWGLSDTIADGTLDRRHAVDLFVRFVEGTLSSTRTRGKSR
ncbi:MAG TPA: TetR/AcrR family transcriptional regulator [Candidatus Binatia bacterium]|nr:TetR/AcrR family transcriptional regulator [Candidatus Binatia bacterium]